MEEIRDVCTGTILNLFELYAKAKTDEERDRISKEIERLHKVLMEDLRVGEMVWKEQQEVELNDLRVKAEIKRLDRELNLKISESEERSKWYNKIKPDTIATCGTLTLLTLAAFRLEKAGYIIPRTLKFVDKLKLL